MPKRLRPSKDYANLRGNPFESRWNLVGCSVSGSQVSEGRGDFFLNAWPRKREQIFNSFFKREMFAFSNLHFCSFADFVSLVEVFITQRNRSWIHHLMNRVQWFAIFYGFYFIVIKTLPRRNVYLFNPSVLIFHIEAIVADLFSIGWFYFHLSLRKNRCCRKCFRI